MIILRPYQAEAVEAICKELETKDTSLLVLPTGTGKSEIMFELCDRLQGTVLIASHKVNLVEQTARRAVKSGKKVGIYCKSLSSEKIAPITIASVQSINSLQGISFDYLIVDEAHKLPNKKLDSHYKRLIDSIITEQPNLKIVGVTATPYRATGYIYGDDKSWFTGVAYSKNMKEMIAAGYLVMPRLKRTENCFDTKGLRVVAGDYSKGDLDLLVSNHELVQKQVKDALVRLDGRKKVAWACTSIKHAELVKSLVPDSVVMHSRLNFLQKNRATRDFETGSARHIVFVTMLSEGYDFPPIDALVFMRPTRSPTLYVQTVGRTLRPSPGTGKTDALILDYGQVVTNLGPVDDPIINIAGKTGKKRLQVAGKFCEACLDYNLLKNKVCTGCGSEFPVKTDPFKQMTSTHQAGLDILSGNKINNNNINKWVLVQSTVMSPKIAQSGRSMIEVSYYPVGKIIPYREYLTFGEHWMTEKSLAKLLRFGISARNYQDAVRLIPSRTKKVTHIQVKQNGKYMEVVDAIYESIANS